MLAAAAAFRRPGEHNHEKAKSSVVTTRAMKALGHA